MCCWSSRPSNFFPNLAILFTFMHELGPGVENPHQQARLGVVACTGGSSPVIDVRIFDHDEEVERYTRFHSDRQRQLANILAQNFDRVKRGLDEYGKPLMLFEHCIVLRVMLTTAESLGYYKDPVQKKALGEKIKALLKSLLEENNLDFSDVDGIKIDISEDDVQKAEMFFKIGKYHRRWLNEVVIVI